MSTRRTYPGIGEVDHDGDHRFDPEPAAYWESLRLEAETETEEKHVDAEARIVDMTEEQYKAFVADLVRRIHAEYRAETERLVAAGLTDETQRSMDQPRVCHACARVFPGGGECRGPKGRPHREVVMYASNS